MSSSKTVFLCAGEASGDMHGANLMKALRELQPDIRLVGVGGPNMRAEGLECCLEAEKLSFVGLVEVLRHIPFCLHAIRQIIQEIHRSKADIFVPIDFPDFNLNICKKLRNDSITIAYYICPQVWAWRKSRIRQIEDYVDLLLTILPFEKRHFSTLRLKTVFVGHPLLDEVQPTDESRDVKADEGTVAIMPGSRSAEINHHLPALVPAIKKMLDTHPGLRFRIPLAPTLQEKQLRHWLEPVLDASGNGRVEITPAGSSSEVLRNADSALIASGTSTLQAVLLNTPFALFYKLHPLTYWLGKKIIKVKQVGLVNLIAEKKVCRELLQHDMNIHNLENETAALLWNKPYRKSILDNFTAIRKRMGGPGASKRAAEAILNQPS